MSAAAERHRRVIAMKSHPGQTPPAPSRLYWICQAAGWGSFGIYALASYAALAGGRDRLVIAAIVIVDAIVCPAVTHGFRSWIYRRGWMQLGLRRLLPRLITAAFVLAALVTVMVALWSMLIATPERRLTGMPLFWTFVAFVWAFGGWLLIYFTVHARRRHDARELALALDARNAQLALLRAQLNPHFLFNCLNSVRGLIVEHPERAVAMITSLADLLRYSLNSDRRELVTLAEEMTVVDEYVSLERVRFEDRLRIERSIESGAQQVLVPPLLVHTLVENAIKHGVATRTTGGVVRVDAVVSGDQLVVSVSNTGRLSEPVDEAGHGLRNTMERLRLLYGDRASLTLSDGGGDTIARIALPLHGIDERTAG